MCGPSGGALPLHVQRLEVEEPEEQRTVNQAGPESLFPAAHVDLTAPVLIAIPRKCFVCTDGIRFWLTLLAIDGLAADDITLHNCQHADRDSQSGSDLLAQNNTLYLCPWCQFGVVTQFTLLFLQISAHAAGVGGLISKLKLISPSFSFSFALMHIFLLCPLNVLWV